MGIDFTNGVVRTMISGGGFFGDQYANNVMGRVTDIWKTEFMDMSHEDEVLIKMIFYVGAIIGMLSFGTIADLVGRKWAFCATVGLTAIGNFACAGCQAGGSFSLYGQITLCRFFVGVGIGGEYPLVAAVAGEAVSAKRRARAILHCFAMQGWGNIFANLVPFICLKAGASYDFTWRFAFAFGGLVAVIVLPFRCLMHESKMYEHAIENETSEMTKTADKKNSLGRMMRIISHYKYHLIGTGGAWLALDFIWYGNSLFGGDVTAAFGLGSSPIDKIKFNLIFAGTFAIFGYYCSVFFVDKVGRKRLQIGSFVMLMVLFAILALCYDTFTGPNANRGTDAAFIILYGLTFFFNQFGPNSTTYLIPGEIYTSSVRTTCHGISAAMGKFGAILVSISYSEVTDNKAKMWMAVAFGVLGLVLTIVFVPTYSSEDLDCINTGRAPLLDYSCVRPKVLLDDNESDGHVVTEKQKDCTSGCKSVV